MEKLKKIILLISGVGSLLVIIIGIFVQLFTTGNAKSWIVGGFVVFFVVFIPLYVFEYFSQSFKNKNERGKIQFKKRNTRTEWEGGNIHGKVPKEVDRPGKFFRER